MKTYGESEMIALRGFLCKLDLYCFRHLRNRDGNTTPMLAFAENQEVVHFLKAQVTTLRPLTATP